MSKRTTPLCCGLFCKTLLLILYIQHNGDESPKDYGVSFLFLNLSLTGKAIYMQLKQTNQPDATISPVYYLMFIYSSTCFGRPHAHHQELNNCSSSLWFYRWNVVVAVLLVVVGPADQLPGSFQPPQRLTTFHVCKTRGC
jgi:hypothetical protein